MADLVKYVITIEKIKKAIVAYRLNLETTHEKATEEWQDSDIGVNTMEQFEALQEVEISFEESLEHMRTFSDLTDDAPLLMVLS